MRTIGLGLLSLVLAGCASITPLGNTFEGAADYRVIPIDDPEKPEIEPLISKAVPLDDFHPFQVHPSKIGANDARFFAKGDHIRINMRSALFGWFAEGKEQQLLNDLVGAPTKGEIAIIANVTEGKRTAGGRDDKGDLQGRVVFYSDDIYKNQRSNEFDIPIYGPAPYEGGPLSIDLWVLELDRAESEQMSALLTSLSDLSKDVSSVAVPGAGILHQLGTAFLNSNQDDVIGHLAVTLYQPRAALKATDAILQQSDIVVSRVGRSSAENRKVIDGCLYVPRDSAVVDGGGYPCGLKTGDGHTNIIVLGIRKVPEGASVASELTFAELNDRLSKARVGSAQTPNFTTAIEEATDVAMSDGAYNDAVASLERVASGSAGAARELDADTILKNLQCGLMAARHSESAVLGEVCGGERALQRQIGINDLARVTRRLAAETCLSDSDLSFDSLLPAELSADALRQKRSALYSKIRPRSDEACALFNTGT